MLSTETLSSGTSDSEDLPAGTIGRFEVLGMLGRGGMGVVLAARDPALGRRVAIKLVTRWGSEAARERFAREAQAMAQLSHPNVLAIYEVGEQDARPFIAMELVEGTTLRAWQEGTPRTWREVLAIYFDAGRGLSALHAAGIVHRDFKPDNVLLGADLRPRVSDFGLAVELGEALTPSTEDVVDTGQGLTVGGRIVGTPPYMAREQWLGEAATASTDQFAFCVSLWEAVFGERPFAGATTTELQAQICAGRHAPPREVRGAPRWLVQALQRGLATRPEERWPGMEALLARLARGARRRWWPVAALAVAALGAGGTALALSFGAPADTCTPRAQASARDVWGEGGKAAFVARVRAIDPPNATVRIAAIERYAEPLIADWQRLFGDACRASATSADLLAEQRTACLDAHLAELRGVLAELRSAPDGATVDRTLPTLAELGMRGCADAKVLASYTPAPTPLARFHAAAIEAEARGIELDRLAGRMGQIHERGQALLARARTLDHAPTTARALEAVARMEADRGDSDTTLALLRELVTVASRAPDDYAAAHAWLSQMLILAFDRHQPADALAILPMAQAAVVRAGEPIELRVTLAQQIANVYTEVGRTSEALAELAKIQHELTAVGADDPLSSLHDRVAETWATIGTVYIEMREWDKAIAAFEKSVVAHTEAFGVDHPLVAFTYLNIGHCYRQKQELDKALAASAEAMRIRRARLGPSPGLAWAINMHANALRELGRPQEAAAEGDEAFMMAEATMAPDEPNRIAIAVGTAALYADLGKIPRAKEIYTAAIDLAVRVGIGTSNVAIAYLNRGDLLRQENDCTAALLDYRRSLELFESYGAGHLHYQAYPLRSQGHCLVLSGRNAEAVAPLERVLALPPEPFSRDQVIAARYLLGVARTRMGEAEGPRLVEQARREASAVSKELRAELDGLPIQ